MARTPLYKAAETEMIRRIETGEWAVGQRLPNEFILADEFRVSQGTMRRALMTLEGMGLLHRKPGRGTIVQERRANGSMPGADAPVRAMTLRTMAGDPVNFEVQRSKSGLRGATPEESALFGTGRLVFLERLMRRMGTRTALEETVVPESLRPALDENAPVALDALLDAHGVPADRIDESVEARVTTMQESVSLSCDRHAALLVLTRTAHDPDGKAIAQQVMKVLGTGLRYA